MVRGYRNWRCAVTRAQHCKLYPVRFCGSCGKSTQETVNLAVLDQGTVLYVDVIESPHEFRLSSRVGTRRSVHVTALGKALVAFLPAEQRENILITITFQPSTSRTIMNLLQFRQELDKIRRQGYAVDDEEAVQGARCVSAPILNADREPIASVSVSGPVTQSQPQPGRGVGWSCDIRGACDFRCDGILAARTGGGNARTHCQHFGSHLALPRVPCSSLALFCRNATALIQETANRVILRKPLRCLCGNLTSLARFSHPELGSCAESIEFGIVGGDLHPLLQNFDCFGLTIGRDQQLCELFEGGWTRAAVTDGVPKISKCQRCAFSSSFSSRFVCQCLQHIDVVGLSGLQLCCH